jgi:hypothetical protein
MTYFDNRSRRDAAARLHGLLSDVRAAPRDARNYVLFERRDELNGLGVDDGQINAFDARDEATLDHHIAQANAVARGIGHRDNDAVTVTAQVGEPSPFGEGYTTLYPRTYDPKRSSGLSAQATQAMIDAAKASRRMVAPNGGGERAVVGVPDGVGGFRIVRPQVRTQSTPTADIARVRCPPTQCFSAMVTWKERTVLSTRP